MTSISPPRALCIGNFDGVHKGHQALLNAAKAVSSHVVALSFEPHPRQIFQPDAPPFRITTPEQKRHLLRRFGAVEVITWPFSRDLAAVPAPLFIEHVLLKQCRADIIIVGEDFHFGKDRDGNIALLQSYADQGAFDLVVVPLHGEAGDRYSSSLIREMLKDGDMASASTALGWNYCIESEVVRGDQRGRTMGFPTANQILGDRLAPAYGVYASFVWIDGVRYLGATNIGIRPMFEVAQPLVETHIFDFDRDIYGQMIGIEPVARLRGEKKYDDLETLIAAIANDCKEARELLTSLP